MDNEGNLFTPFISVIIPTYNRPDELQQVCRLLTNQLYSRWEAIIVDDSQETMATYDAWQTDSRFRYFHRNQKSGVSAARNFGVQQAAGSYIIFLDDDDTISNLWLFDFAQLVRENITGELFFCGYEQTDTFTKNKRLVMPGVELWRVIYPGSFMITKSLFEKSGGYDSRILYGENTELFFRIRRLNPSYAFTNQVNYFYNPSHDGGSKNIQNIIDSHKIVLEKHADLFNEQKLFKKLYLRMIGVSLIKLNKVKEARKYLWQSYLLAPLEIKSLLRLLACLYPLLAKRIYS